MPRTAVGTFTLEPDTARPYDFYIEEGRKWLGPISVMPFVSAQTEGWDTEPVQLRVQWVAHSFIAPDIYGYACGIYNTSNKTVTFELQVAYET
jgi:hypothetical protein